MPVIRHTFLQPPSVGDTYVIGARSYEIVSSEPYARRGDGSDSALFVWQTDCEECNKRFTFKTGPTAGNIQTRCTGCRAIWWREIDERRKRAVHAELECRQPADPLDVYHAVQAAQGDQPRQMSLARNASRRIFGPLLLREAYAPLSEYTIAEILAGIHDALRRGLIMWDAVDRYRCGHARKGLVARPEWWLRRNGWWPAESVLD